MMRIWAPGYTQSQLDAAQQAFGLTFPPDLIDLLREKRPLKGHDWADKAEIQKMLDWPLHGLLFDVENNAFWWPEWGEKPDSPGERKEVLQAVVARAPRLIPLYSHRYLPETPNETGNPVFSVHQSDVIYYGTNLTDYFAREFGEGTAEVWDDNLKYIPFWSDLEARDD